MKHLTTVHKCTTCVAIQTVTVAVGTNWGTLNDYCYVFSNQQMIPVTFSPHSWRVACHIGLCAAHALPSNRHQLLLHPQSHPLQGETE